MPNAQQTEYWNGTAGDHWVAYAEQLDSMLQHVGDALLAQASLQSGERVLDVGCGSGALTLAAQERIGHTGCAIGVDISQPLIANAQRRATLRGSHATFIVGDAARWRDRRQSDAIISRFGVMFFDDPVAAFKNLASSVKHDGRLHFACWRSPKENDMGSGLMKAASHLFTPPATKPDPTAPGPFAFADSDRVKKILAEAGWRDVACDTWNGTLPLPGDTVRDSAIFLTRTGGLSRLLQEQNVAVERVIDAITPFLEQRLTNGRVALQGAAWLVSAGR